MAGASRQIVDADSHLVGVIKNRLQIVPTLPTTCSIFKVPVNLRNVKESAYIPKVVSIGPLHHGEHKLNPMEDHKLRYLKSCLNRRSNANTMLEVCVSKLRGLESTVRNNYFEDQFSQKFSSDKFVTMMLLDSFFIIELFILDYIEKVHIHDPMFNGHSVYMNDPMFNGHSVYMNVYHDLMLLENQLPYFLLEDLYNLIHGYGDTEKTFNDLLVSFFNDETTHMTGVVPSISPGYKLKHFVDYFLHCYVPTPYGPQQPPNDGSRKTISLPSAAELRESGIKIKKCTSGCFLDIWYGDGVLEIPTLHFEDNTEDKLRNLVAMEQCCKGSRHYITDYVILMDFLINTPTDVALLRSYGVVDNFLGSDEDVCRLINDIGKGVCRNTTDFYYYKFSEEINAYYNRRRHRWLAKLKKQYFNNPWTVLSLIAAVFLLICTFIQSVCSVISAKN